MTPRTSHISPHTESSHTILDYLAALTNCQISSGRLRIPCPAHGGTNPNLSIWANGDVAVTRSHSAGCSYADIAAAIKAHYQTPIDRRRYRDNPIPVDTKATGTKRRAKPHPNPPALPYQSSHLRPNIETSQRPLQLSKAHRATA